MNSLSWFLYFAGVVGNITAAISILSVLVIGVLVVCGCCNAGHYSVRSEDEIPVFFKTARWALIPMFVLVLTAFIPSKDTLYAIAASQMGEKVIESSIGQKSMKALEQWIEKQTVAK